jgi:hypothetical protein
VQQNAEGVGVRLMKRRGELILIRRAINQGWSTSTAMQHEAIELVLSILDDPDATNREKSGAMNTLHAMIRSEAATDAEIRKRAADAMRRYSPKSQPNGV